MRNTCVVFIPRVTAQVQLRIVTNEQRHCDMPENAPLHTPQHLTFDPRHPTPGNPNLISGTKHLNPGTTGSQTTLTLGTEAKGSTYASRCYVPPKGPFPDPLAWGK